MLNEQQIDKAALFISEYLIEENAIYAGTDSEDDYQLCKEIICGLLQDNPEECEKLVGTVFCPINVL